MMMMFNRCSFCRLITPISSSSFRDGSSNRLLKQYHTSPTLLTATLNHNSNIQGETEPFSIIDPCLIPSLDGIDSWKNEKTSFEILGSGMILLKNYIPLMDQVDIVNTCQKWGVGPGGFYEPRNQSGAKLRLHMMCFGKNWDPITKYKSRCRSDGSEPLPLPNELIHLAETAIKDAQAHSKNLPSMCPDICIVNFYTCTGGLGLHQDCDESFNSLKKGLPVVSISVGDTAEFVYGNTRDKVKLQRVLLESGDVLIFGGKSRHVFHGVKKILPGTSPQPLVNATGFRPGRLNLTFRKF
ncbi:hypothetical protein R6Q59_012001 [Mikania micrantha]